MSNSGCGTTHEFVDHFIYEGNKQEFGARPDLESSGELVEQTGIYWDNDDYLNNVRVDSKTFWYLVDKLRPFLERQKTSMRLEPLEVDEIIAIVLRRLGSGDFMAS